MGAHLRDDPRHPLAFRRLLAGAWASNLGDGVRLAALPLIAASLGESASVVTTVAAASTVPFALFGLLAGTLADRHARAPLIVRAHLFRAVVMGALAAALIADEMTVPLLVAGAFLLGCGEAIADSAAPALVPDLVDGRKLESANGELETAELVANDLAGPPIGSVLFAAAPSAPFVLDAVSFVAAATMVSRIAEDHEPPPPEGRPSWRTDLVEAATTAWTNPVLRVTGVLVAFLQLGNMIAMAPIVVYLTDRLDLEPAAYGLFLAVGAIGGIAAARLVAPIVSRLGSFATLALAIVVSTGAFVLMAVPNLVTVTAGFAMSFGGVVTGRIVVLTARQRSVPKRLLGRAQGAIRMLLWAAASIGAVLGGLVYDGIDPRAPFVVAAVLYVATLAAGWTSLRRVLDDPDAVMPTDPGSTARAARGGRHLIR